MSVFYRIVSIHLDGVVIDAKANTGSMDEATAREMIINLSRQLAVRALVNRARAVQAPTLVAPTYSPAIIASANKVRQYLDMGFHVFIYEVGKPRTNCVMLAEKGKGKLNRVMDVEKSIEQTLIELGKEEAGREFKLICMPTKKARKEESSSFGTRDVLNGYLTNADLFEQERALHGDSGLNKIFEADAKLDFISYEMSQDVWQVLNTNSIHLNNGPCWFITLNRPEGDIVRINGKVSALTGHSIGGCYFDYHKWNSINPAGRNERGAVVLEGSL